MNLRHSQNDAARRARVPAPRDGFTLLEILIVLVLIAIILGGLGALVRVFSGTYAANERRVGRAQLARSISQMLSDDLGAAIQDPIQAVDEDPNRQFIRHFGLRGDSRSLQIDVVQPNLFAPTANVEENRRVISGGDKNPSVRQAPELKTIFYEFVPINATEKLEDDSNSNDSNLPGASSGEDLGSTLTGSLTNKSTDPNVAALNSLSGVDSVFDPSAFVDGTAPYVQKYGLSRRELDFETPDDYTDEESEELEKIFGEGSTIDPTTGQAQSHLAGSLNSVPKTSNSTLTSAVGDAANPFAAPSNENAYFFKPPMTAAQIAMDADDGTTWAPEVLDCRFSYYDGSNWLDSWDSIEKKGLPIAIKVELKLAPLDDIDLYRDSPLIFSLPIAPDPETVAKLRDEKADEPSGTGVNVSRLSGSLAANPSGKSGEPVDVFNSYRPTAAIRAAFQGTPVSLNSAASPFDSVSTSQTLDQTGMANVAQNNIEGTDAEEDPLGGLGGGLGGGLDGLDGGLDGFNDENTLAGGLNQTPGADPNGMDAMTNAFAQMLANGAVFNAAGVCVDYSNDGSYVTLEQMAKQIGVAEPIVYEVVAYLPTTPLSRATTIERREPVVARAGNVRTRRNANANSSRERRAQGANPYATGRARQFQDRRANERTVTERAPRERNVGERTRADRGVAGRNVAERGTRDRTAAERGPRERNAGSGRTANARQARERLGANGGWTEDSPNAPNLDAMANDRRNSARQNEPPQAANEPFGGADIFGSAGQNVGNELSGGLNGGRSGGLSGGGRATQIGALDPFAIVDEQQETVPFAGVGGGFGVVDSAFDGLTPGLIQSSTGSTTVASQASTPNSGVKKEQQTWIRGKR